MKRNLLWLAVALTLLLISSLSLADIDTGIVCATDEDCEIYNGYYCNEDTLTCFEPQEEETAEETTTTTVTTETTEATTDETQDAKITDLETEVDEVKTTLASLSSNLQQLEIQVNNVKSQLSQILRNVNDVKTSTSQIPELSQQTNTVSSGLASLQEELETTQGEIDSIEENLEKEKSYTGYLTYFFILVVIIAGALIFFLGRKRPKVNKEVVGFITGHLKQGKKFEHIKSKLAKAGWKDHEISAAYQHTVNQNYRQYKQQGAKTPKRGKSPAAVDKQKVIVTTVFAIILVFAVLLILRGTVGKAFFVERYINTSSGEIFDFIQCTPPQILNPDGDACCTDADNNTLCDILEREVAELVGECSDNLQCETSEYCIDGACNSLSSIYEGSAVCDRSCSSYSISLAANGESYNLGPGRGSYTCVGALEWKIMEAPTHCNGEQAVVPIKVIYKEPGRVLGEEVFTLRARENTIIEHPTLSCSLDLTVSNVYETCV